LKCGRDYLVVLLLDAIEARFEAIAAGIGAGVAFGEIVNAGPDVDVILGRIRSSTCERGKKKPNEKMFLPKCENFLLAVN
jgi:hypothetical protein